MSMELFLIDVLIIVFIVIPVLFFVVKAAVKDGILEAYEILQNEKENDNRPD